MKRILILMFCSIFLFTSCGDDGPPGPPGPPGEDGLYVVGETYEYDVNFTYFDDENLYSAFLEFPAVEPSDGVLVYRNAVIQNVETWSLIPQNFFLPGGIIQYVYTHTDEDVELIIDGNFDLSNLPNQYTTNQVFRVIIVPSDYASTSGIDVTNMEAVMQSLNIQNEDFIMM